MYYIGVDGGGTKTAFALFDENKIRSFVDMYTLLLELCLDENKYIKDVSVTDIYIGCGLCTNTTAKKIIPDTSLNIRHWNQIRDDLKTNYDSDVFVKQIIRFIDRETRSSK